MRAGYLITAVGFFLSSFYFNISGIRILPPFIGLFVMVLGISKIRNYYSSTASKAASSVFKIVAVVSVLGSFVSLSRYTDESPLEFALPALPYLFALSNVLSAVAVAFFFIQAYEYFSKYSTCATMWKVARAVVPALYTLCQAIMALNEFKIAEGLSPLVFLLGIGVNILLIALLIVAAMSDHTAVAKEPDPEKKK